MSATTHLPPAASPGSSGAPRPSGAAGSGRAPISPYKPVLFVTLLLFAPALRETLQGNMLVQTALLRFIGSAAAAYVVVWLVLSVVQSYAAKRDAAAAASAAVATAAGAEGAGSAGSTAFEDGMRAAEADPTATGSGSLGNTGP